MDARFMDTRIRLVRSDTGPQVRVVLTDESTGTAINLSGGTATLYLKSLDTNQLVLTRALVIPSGTATAGVAVIVWQANDLDHPPGDYDGEVEVVLSTGIRQTVYDVLKFRIREDFA